MEHIQDIYAKKPEMIEKLFDHLTKVDFNITGKSFHVFYNESKDDLEYHTNLVGDDNTSVSPIDVIDRLFSESIDNAINHIEERKEAFKNYIFLSLKIISENLFLTSAITKNNRLVDDPDELSNISEELEIDTIPAIHQGNLSESQKEKIIEALSNNVSPNDKDFIKDLFGDDIEISENYNGFVFSYDVGGKIVKYEFSDEQSSNILENKIDESKLQTIYDIFVDWAKDNASKLGNNSMESIELNFIEMMEDPKRFNKLMGLATELTTSNIDEDHSLQLDKVCENLRKNVQRHGKVYELLYENFLRLFWNAKKRNFTISKEFQQDVNKICGMVGESLEDNEYVEMVSESIVSNKIDYANELEHLIDYLEQIKSKNKSNKDINEIIKSDNITKSLLRSFKSLNITKNFDETDDFNKFDAYCKISGLDVKTAKHMLNELSDEGYEMAMSIINDNINKLEIKKDNRNVKKMHVKHGNNLIFDENIHTYKELFTSLADFSDKDIFELVKHTQKLGKSSKESDGPGEHAMALLFINARKASGENERGDLQIDFSGNGNYVNVELKAGGVLSSIQCDGNAREIWNRTAKELFGINELNWPERPSKIDKDGNAIENIETINTNLWHFLREWWIFEPTKVTEHANVIWKNVHKMYNIDSHNAPKEVIEIVNNIYSNFAQTVKLEDYNKLSKAKKRDANKEHKAQIDLLIKLVGSICLCAYAQMEKFSGMLISDKTKTNILYIDNILDNANSITGIYKNGNIGISGAPKGSFGGGGMTIILKNKA